MSPKAKPKGLLYDCLDTETGRYAFVFDASKSPPFLELEKVGFDRDCNSFFITFRRIKGKLIAKIVGELKDVGDLNDEV